jgi:hypothetical protein
MPGARLAPSRQAVVGSAEVESGADRPGELGLLLIEKMTDLRAERGDRDGRDVIAGCGAALLKPVAGAEQDLGR